MAERKPKPKKESGSARLIRCGRWPVLIAPTLDEKDILDRAAAIDGRKLAAFALFHAVKAAKKILEKKPNSA